MSLRIKTNAAALFAINRANNTFDKSADNLYKLTRGERVARAADDPAGMGISENLKARIRSSRRAIRNGQDGISLIQLAEGHISEMSGFATRMKELAIQAASDTLVDSQREMINKEFQEIKRETKRIADSSNYNGIKLFDGSNELLELQVGTGGDKTKDRIALDRSLMHYNLSSLGILESSIATKDEARQAIDRTNVFMRVIGEKRAKMGAFQAWVLRINDQLDKTTENYAATNSRVRDLDFGQATAEKVSNEIKLDATTATLAQASNLNNQVLKLIH